MARKIVVLSDGTGNSSAALWRTNVWRTFAALDLSGSDQVAFYDHGVGLLLTAEKKFWHCVESGETPALFGVKPPRPRIEAVRIVDMNSSNSWGGICRTRRAVKRSLSMKGIRSASEVCSRPDPPALLSETGATAPTGNRYGDAGDHPCMAIAGLEQSAITLETGSADRLANMHVFAATALNLMLQKPSH